MGESLREEIRLIQEELSRFKEDTSIINQRLEKLILQVNNIEQAKISLLNLSDYVNSQENFFITTDGKELKFANKYLLSFFNYESLLEFKKDHKCVCELFLKTDRFFDLRKVSNPQEWIIKISELDEKDRIILFFNKKENKKNYFKVVLNKCHDLHVVTFTNITEHLEEKIILEKKAHIDFLTKAYNRDFFNDNKERIINLFSNNSKLGLSILDIDNFKQINDKYGHDKGDYILEKLSKIIKSSLRESDYFIRWGGEEFLLLLRVKDKKDLWAINEKIRKNVFKSNFKIEGKMSISIGAALWKNENIFQTIKRADNNLYTSKLEGKNLVTL